MFLGVVMNQGEITEISALKAIVERLGRLAEREIPSNTEIRSKVLDTKEAAKYLKIVSKQCLERWRKHGKGPRFIQLSNKVGYHSDDLDAFLEQHKFDPGTVIADDGFVA